MRISHPLLVLALGASILQFVSCSKEVDNSNESLSLQTSDEAVVTTSYGNCKLRHILHEHGGVPELLVNGLFTYYADGNPYSITYANGTGTGNPNHYFYYDSKKRLREYRQAYSPNDPVEAIFHRYGYNDKDQAIKDTLFNASGYTEDGGVTFAPRFISTLTYDSKGRISVETSVNSNGTPGTTRTYSYDTRGNLIVPGWNSALYDNKVSIYRSHPVFELINRNYSVNNSAVQPKYNSKGLPNSLRPSNDPFFGAYQSNPGIPYIGGIVRVLYDCD